GSGPGGFRSDRPGETVIDGMGAGVEDARGLGRSPLQPIGGENFTMTRHSQDATVPGTAGNSPRANSNSPTASPSCARDRVPRAGVLAGGGADDNGSLGEWTVETANHNGLDLSSLKDSCSPQPGAPWSPQPSSCSRAEVDLGSVGETAGEQPSLREGKGDKKASKANRRLTADKLSVDELLGSLESLESSKDGSGAAS
ncbi:unnamed protein product, partial [Discosporangium mesarthrocarpum]